MYTGRDTCAFSKSLNFTCFGSKNTLFFFDNEVHSEKCIVFYRFPEEDFFLISNNMFEHKWCPVYFHYAL